MVREPRHDKDREPHHDKVLNFVIESPEALERECHPEVLEGRHSLT